MLLLNKKQADPDLRDHSRIVDVMKEHIAVAEAKRLGIPVFAIVDTNSNPDEIDYVIPANDDASKSIEVILEAVCGAMAEGLEERKVEKIDAEDKEDADAPAAGKRRRVRRNEERAAAPEAEVEVKEEVKEAE